MSHPMGIGKAIRLVRKARGLTQEDFSEVSSRTYLSSLERDLKSPTLDKLMQLANVAGVHPATLIAVSMLPTLNESRVDALLSLLERELRGLVSGD
ncbi:helix-turn-helix transcriptional regulator [Caballeronia sp. LZ016]|uniref:helix-turn-helix domain-containing protein n=1 Tax=Caballeronia sp. LZ016 TaxID=3038554 RepID=UPI00286422ED|nr:helix-turn-helix transcriptional regulator [Caballeronia sp. LZ016]MDR5740078.1 helix-turn-helix transcriptional regulator [Caballeronia sp. LZ016]